MSKPDILIPVIDDAIVTVKVWTNNNDYAKVTSDILEFSKSEISL